MNLRRAKDTRCMERTPGTSSSLCVCAKNRQILVCGEWYANRLQMAQHRFAVPSTHMHIWFENRLRVVPEPFGTLVFTRLNTVWWEGEAIVQHIVIGDETWILHNTAATKQQSIVWKQSDESAPKKFKLQLSVNEGKLTVFWGWKGSLYKEYLTYKRRESITQCHTSIPYFVSTMRSDGNCLDYWAEEWCLSTIMRRQTRWLLWRGFLPILIGVSSHIRQFCRISYHPTLYCLWSWRMLRAESGFNRMWRLKCLRSHFLPILMLVYRYHQVLRKLVLHCDKGLNRVDNYVEK